MRGYSVQSGAYIAGAHPARFRGGAKHLWLQRHKQQVLGEIARDGYYAVAFRYNCEPVTLLEMAHRAGLPLGGGYKSERWMGPRSSDAPQ